MARWVACYMCGCTGVHRDPATGTDYPCTNGCEGGRVYETVNPEWFERLVKCGAEIFEEEDWLHDSPSQAATCG